MADNTQSSKAAAAGGIRTSRTWSEKVREHVFYLVCYLLQYREIDVVTDVTENKSRKTVVDVTKYAISLENAYVIKAAQISKYSGKDTGKIAISVTGWIIAIVASLIPALIVIYKTNSPDIINLIWGWGISTTVIIVCLVLLQTWTFRRLAINREIFFNASIALLSRSDRNQNYQAIASVGFHNYSHILRDINAKISAEHDCKPDLKRLLDGVCKVLHTLHRPEILAQYSGCIKYLASENEIRTLARSESPEHDSLHKTRLIQTTTNVTSVKGNTAFEMLIDEETPRRYFYVPNVGKALDGDSDVLSFCQISQYKNKNDKSRYHYLSALAIPIRTVRFMDGEPRNLCVGFLCFDSRTENAFEISSYMETKTKEEGVPPLYNKVLHHLFAIADLLGEVLTRVPKVGEEKIQVYVPSNKSDYNYGPPTLNA